MGITLIIARFVLAFVVGGALCAGALKIKAVEAVAAMLAMSLAVILVAAGFGACVFISGSGNPVDFALASIDLNTWLIITGVAGFDVGSVVALWLIIQND